MQVWESVIQRVGADGQTDMGPCIANVLPFVTERLGDGHQDVRQAACNLMLETLQVGFGWSAGFGRSVGVCRLAAVGWLALVAWVPALNTHISYAQYTHTQPNTRPSATCCAPTRRSRASRPSGPTVPGRCAMGCCSFSPRLSARWAAPRCRRRVARKRRSWWGTWSG